MKLARRFSLQRFAALDQAVRAGKYPNARTLAVELEVSSRTVQRDIEFLRDRLGVPLAYDEIRHGYYYTDPTYRLPTIALSEGELVAIFLAERVLQQFRGTPYARLLARAFAKITAALDDRVTVDLGHLGGAISFRTTAASDVDPDLFGELSSAVWHRRRLVLRYETASRGEEATREVDPYHLASVDGQWYLIGFCHLRSSIRMFAPSRIRSIEVTESTFTPSEDFRIDGYLAGSFGVLRGDDGEQYRVKLRFTGAAATYIQERTWHPSQAIVEHPDGGLILHLEVSHLREVERWALSWGADCEVLEPPELRARMVETLARAATSYATDRNTETTRAEVPKNPRARPRRSAPRRRS